MTVAWELCQNISYNWPGLFFGDWHAMRTHDGDTPSTATYRKLAELYEKRLEWTKAASAWESAVAAYPARLESHLASLDKTRMMQRAMTCRASAKVA